MKIILQISPKIGCYNVPEESEKWVQIDRLRTNRSIDREIDILFSTI